MMKGTLVLSYVAVFSFFLIIPQEFVSARQSQPHGKVEGVVLLTAKETSVSVGGRYGRPSRSAGSTASVTDSVLIWLESSSSSSGKASETPVLLDQKDLSFSPSLLPVRQHGSVRIRNSDPVYHNVFSLSPKKRFDVGRRPKGQYLDVTFDQPGAVDVFCDIHSNMRATIYVMPPSVITWTKVKNGDSFSFDHIASGDYQLRVYALGYQEKAIPVEIISEEAIEVGTVTLNF